MATKNLLQPALEVKLKKKIRPVHQADIPVNFIKQRMIEDVVVKFGTTRPDGSDHTKAFFNTSSGVLSMWDGSSWLSTTLS